MNSDETYTTAASTLDEELQCDGSTNKEIKSLTLDAKPIPIETADDDSSGMEDNDFDALVGEFFWFLREKENQRTSRKSPRTPINGGLLTPRTRNAAERSLTPRNPKMVDKENEYKPLEVSPLNHNVETARLMVGDGDQREKNWAPESEIRKRTEKSCRDPPEEIGQEKGTEVDVESPSQLLPTRRGFEEDTIPNEIVFLSEDEMSSTPVSPTQSHQSSDTVSSERTIEVMRVTGDEASYANFNPTQNPCPENEDKESTLSSPAVTKDDPDEQFYIFWRQKGLIGRKPTPTRNVNYTVPNNDARDSPRTSITQEDPSISFKDVLRKQQERILRNSTPILEEPAESIDSARPESRVQAKLEDCVSPPSSTEQRVDGVPPTEGRVSKAVEPRDASPSERNQQPNAHETDQMNVSVTSTDAFAIRSDQSPVVIDAPGSDYCCSVESTSKYPCEGISAEPATPESDFSPLTPTENQPISANSVTLKTQPVLSSQSDDASSERVARLIARSKVLLGSKADPETESCSHAAFGNVSTEPTGPPISTTTSERRVTFADSHTEYVFGGDENSVLSCFSQASSVSTLDAPLRNETAYEEISRNTKGSDDVHSPYDSPLAESSSWSRSSNMFDDLLVDTSSPRNSLAKPLNEDLLYRNESESRGPTGRLMEDLIVAALPCRDRTEPVTVSTNPGESLVPSVDEESCARSLTYSESGTGRFDDHNDSLADSPMHDQDDKGRSSFDPSTFSWRESDCTSEASDILSSLLSDSPGGEEDQSVGSQTSTLDLKEESTEASASVVIPLRDLTTENTTHDNATDFGACSSKRIESSRTPESPASLSDLLSDEDPCSLPVASLVRSTESSGGDDETGLAPEKKTSAKQNSIFASPQRVQRSSNSTFSNLLSQWKEKTDNNPNGHIMSPQSYEKAPSMTTPFWSSKSKSGIRFLSPLYKTSEKRIDSRTWSPPRKAQSEARSLSPHTDEKIWKPTKGNSTYYVSLSATKPEEVAPASPCETHDDVDAKSIEARIDVGFTRLSESHGEGTSIDGEVDDVPSASLHAQTPPKVTLQVADVANADKDTNKVSALQAETQPSAPAISKEATVNDAESVASIPSQIWTLTSKHMHSTEDSRLSASHSKASSKYNGYIGDAPLPAIGSKPEETTIEDLPCTSSEAWTPSKASASCATETDQPVSTGAASDDSCACSELFSRDDVLVEFFLPKLADGHSCGKRTTILIDSDPIALHHILRPWQVQFLRSVDIYRGDQLVKECNKRAGTLAGKMRQWRLSHDMTPTPKTLSCGMALHIWSRTCKYYVRSIRRQMADGMVEVEPPTLSQIMTSFLDKNNGVSVPVEHRLSLLTMGEPTSPREM